MAQTEDDGNITTPKAHSVTAVATHRYSNDSRSQYQWMPLALGLYRWGICINIQLNTKNSAAMPISAAPKLIECQPSSSHTHPISSSWLDYLLPSDPMYTPPTSWVGQSQTFFSLIRFLFQHHIWTQRQRIEILKRIEKLP